ncbi:two-component system, NtrC family, response regulator HydG [Belliella buryatensis]|uniref:Two-component system, NtrC family, response regulator HydG n=1 Tax=Belliella buryatensis TaxID=1500549 RepID=A0A239AI30_9BACT|nr:sigma-54 dependent transcriptional regulator [Belliella buryatensis]SNR95307.1 two-component system, NtrC family, response regulator HydG [Belliella buryatensis]
MKHILLVEDDLSYSRIIKTFLEKNGFHVFATDQIKEALLIAKREEIDLIITDFRLPDGTGLELMSQYKALNSITPTILITNYADIRIAVKAMKMGAFEYITKPINPDELLLTVKDALKSPKPTEDSSNTNSIHALDYIIGKSQDAIQLENHIQLVAPTDLNVLILGETGTGKEYISRRIHQLSYRSQQSFVAVDCGTLSKDLAGSELFGHLKGAFTGASETKAGHFEAAQGGTIFLDEIGNLDYESQIKLLRALEEKKIRKIGSTQEIDIDVRILAATNENLLQQVQEGKFREDLYYRLNEFSITALPLKNRKGDLMLFAEQFLAESSQKLNKELEGFLEEVINQFLQYSWPGNLRELRNVIRRASLLENGSFISLASLPVEISQNVSNEPSELTVKEQREVDEKSKIKETLIATQYNKTKTAELLGIDRKTLYNKMKKYSL